MKDSSFSKNFGESGPDSTSFVDEANSRSSSKASSSQVIKYWGQYINFKLTWNTLEASFDHLFAT